MKANVPKCCLLPPTNPAASLTTLSWYWTSNPSPTSGCQHTLCQSSSVHLLDQYTSKGKPAGEAGFISGDSWHHPWHKVAGNRAFQSWYLFAIFLIPLCVSPPPDMASNKTATACHAAPEEVEWLARSANRSQLSFLSQWWPRPIRAVHCVPEASLS